jgi:hypothetical protein
MIPAALPTVVYGPALSGKSTLITEAAAAATRGCEITGGKLPDKVNVAWLAGEEPIEEIVLPRLAAASADLRRVYFPQLRRGPERLGWRLLEDPALWRRMVSELRIGLLVIDPVACFLGSETPPESNLAARRCLETLTNLGKETGVASVVLKHPRKSGRGSSQEQMSGGLEWFNTPRSVLLVGLHPGKEGARVAVQQKPSLSPGAGGVEFVIQQLGGMGRAHVTRAADVRAVDVLTEELSGVDRSALEEAKEFLVEYLKEGERRTSDLQKWAQEAGLAWITIRRAKFDLNVSSEWRSEDGTKHRVWVKRDKGS